MQTTQSAPEFGLAIGQLLIAVRRLIRAEYAEILLFPTERDPGLRSTINSQGEIQTQSTDAAISADLLARFGASAASRARTGDPFRSRPRRPSSPNGACRMR